MFENHYLNKNSPVPLYYQLKEIIREFIDSNEHGTYLPTEKQLSELFRISRPTVRQAMKELETEGHIRREKGRGTCIVKTNINIERVYQATPKDAIYVPLSHNTNVVLLHNRKIGISLFTHKSSYFNILRDTITSELSKFGVNELIADANDDAEKQYDEIASFIGENVDLIIVDPVSPPSPLGPVLERAYSFNIPVLAVNSHLDPESKFLAYVGCDNYELGVRSGVFVGCALKNKHGDMKGNIAIIEGDPGNIAGAERGEGFLAGLRKIGSLSNVNIVDRQCGNWSFAGGEAAARTVLAHHSRVDFVYAYSDSIALGGIQAANDMGRAEVRFSSIDGSRNALRTIVEKGPLVSIGLNDPIRIGRLAATLAVSFLSTGIVPSKSILTEPILITRENVNAFYDPESPF